MRTRMLLLATAAALTLAACDSATEQLAEEVAEQAAEAGGAGDTEIDVDEDGSVSVETDEGSFQIDASGDGELPEGFPDEVPLPADYTVVSSASFSDDSGEAVQVTLEAPGLDVVAYVEDEVVSALEDAGYEIQGQSVTTTNDVTVGTVVAEDGTSAVNLSAQEQPDGEPIVSIQVFPAS